MFGIRSSFTCDKVYKSKGQFNWVWWFDHEGYFLWNTFLLFFKEFRTMWSIDGWKRELLMEQQSFESADASTEWTGIESVIKVSFVCDWNCDLKHKKNNLVSVNFSLGIHC